MGALQARIGSVEASVEVGDALHRHQPLLLRDGKPYAVSCLLDRDNYIHYCWWVLFALLGMCFIMASMCVVGTAGALAYWLSWIFVSGLVGFLVLLYLWFDYHVWCLFAIREPPETAKRILLHPCTLVLLFSCVWFILATIMTLGVIGTLPPPAARWDPPTTSTITLTSSVNAASGHHSPPPSSRDVYTRVAIPTGCMPLGLGAPSLSCSPELPDTLVQKLERAVHVGRSSFLTLRGSVACDRFDGDDPHKLSTNQTIFNKIYECSICCTVPVSVPTEILVLPSWPCSLS